MMQELQSLEYQKLVIGFKEWLQTLGYAKSTVYGTPKMLKEFLLFLEEKECNQIKVLTLKTVEDFLIYFKNRPNKRRKGGLSIAHINKQIDTLNKFFKYLKVVRNLDLKINLKKLKEEEEKQRVVLTKSEIQELYKATDNSILGMRDKAMLAIYYGCGLRKTEGLELDVSDIDFDKKLLYVRKPKNGYERFVPINLRSLNDLENYIFTARPLLINEQELTDSLFISERGKKITGQSLISRLKYLVNNTENQSLKDKSFGLHALRHSIATHLLQAGMELENIALFLGHKTLDSTQLYTHLINEND